MTSFKWHLDLVSFFLFLIGPYQTVVHFSSRPLLCFLPVQQMSAFAEKRRDSCRRWRAEASLRAWSASLFSQPLTNLYVSFGVFIDAMHRGQRFLFSFFFSVHCVSRRAAVSSLLATFFPFSCLPQGLHFPPRSFVF